MKTNSNRRGNGYSDSRTERFYRNQGDYRNAEDFFEGGQNYGSEDVNFGVGNAQDGYDDDFSYNESTPYNQGNQNYGGDNYGEGNYGSYQGNSQNYGQVGNNYGNEGEGDYR